MDNPVYIITREVEEEYYSSKQIVAVLLRPSNVLDPNAILQHFNYDGTGDYEEAFVDFLVELGYKKLNFFEC